MRPSVPFNMAEYQRKTKPQFIFDFVSKSEIPPVRIRVVRVKFLSETVGDHFEAGASILVSIGTEMWGGSALGFG